MAPPALVVRYAIDTNRLVYANGASDPWTHKRAQDVLARMIWAAAKLGQIPILLSEDFDSGATLEGVSFLDPFDRKLDLLDL